MAPKTSKSTTVNKAPEAHGYEFGGPIGTTGIVFGLPILLYVFTFFCNDISGCPVPSALSPSTIQIEQLKKEIGWPANGIWGLASWEVTAKTSLWYLWSLILYKVLPGEEMEGQPLPVSGKTIKYKFNAWSSTMITLALLLAGTIAQGAEFPVWTFLYDNYLQVLTANIIISYALAIYVYVASFNVKPGDPNFRELALGGKTGNLIYDFYIGRELNPRITLPFFGEIDIKTFLEVRPGLLGWIVYDYAFMARQYRTYGYVTDSMVLTSLFQTLYVLDCFYWESSILTQIDIAADGFGFMLSFGDLVWVPFVYSLQAKYLSVYPHTLGPYGIAGVLSILGIGYYIFRAANSQKNTFRTKPDDPSVKDLEYITTSTGSRLITSGWWWGSARHINYFGDWFQGWAYVLPTGISGYLIQQSSIAPTSGQSLADGSYVYTSNGVETQVVQGAAKGWGMIFTYFYMVYFAVLLIHRERRDEAKCARKYGEDWQKYKAIVKYRILPGVY